MPPSKGWTTSSRTVFASEQLCAKNGANGDRNAQQLCRSRSPISSETCEMAAQCILPAAPTDLEGFSGRHYIFTGPPTELFT